jgi:hypothetical protein
VHCAEQIGARPPGRRKSALPDVAAAAPALVQHQRVHGTGAVEGSGERIPGSGDCDEVDIVGDETVFENPGTGSRGVARQLVEVAAAVVRSEN